jgi:hypothetical protein
MIIRQIEFFFTFAIPPYLSVCQVFMLGFPVSALCGCKETVNQDLIVNEENLDLFKNL